MGQHRLPYPVAINILTYETPAVLCPGHRLQMDDPSPGVTVLEMQEPVIAGSVSHPAALMRPEDIHVSAVHCHPHLVLTGNSGRPQHQLMPGLDSAGRAEYDILPVTFVELRTLSRDLTVFETVEHGDSVRNRGRAIRRQFPHRKNIVEAAAALGPGMHEPDPSVIVPERARIDHPLPRNDTQRLGPFSKWIRSMHLVYSIVGIAPEDVELSVVEAYGRSPHAVAMLGFFRSLSLICYSLRKGC